MKSYISLLLTTSIKCTFSYAYPNSIATKKFERPLTQNSVKLLPLALPIHRHWPLFGSPHKNNNDEQIPIHHDPSPVSSSSVPKYRTKASSSLMPQHQYGCSCGCESSDVKPPEEITPSSFATIAPTHIDAKKMKKAGLLSQKFLDRKLLSSRKARIQFPFISSHVVLPTIFGRAMPSSAVSPSPTQVSSPSVVSSPPVVMKDFNSSLKSYFPGALENDNIVLKRLVPILKKRGFKRSNTLLGSSLCSDEILDGTSSRTLLNSVHGAFGATGSSNNSLGKIVSSSPSGIFSLGGLGGIPAVGTTGFGAFFSHCPDEGKVLIVFGPHVGISNDGIVGKVERLGQFDTVGGVGKRKGSASCGAALGAYRELVKRSNGGKGAKKKSGKEDGLFDYQQDYIVEQLSKRMGKIQGASGGDTNAEIATLTQQMYDIINEVMIAQTRASTTTKAGFFNTISEVVLVGGIVINRGYYSSGDGLGSTKDYYQPLSMKAINAEGTFDLYDEVFGDLS